MADKTIGDLTQAESIGNEDLFVLEQGGEAKKLKGARLVKYAQDTVGAQVTVATEAAESAETAKTGAESAQTQAQAARDAILNMLVEAITLEQGSPATVERSIVGSVYKLTFGLPSGKKGDPGATGPANKLTIGTVTSGTEVSATITGEAPNQVLNLVLKQGDKGNPGDDAPTITGITIRQSDYHMIVTLSDGTSYDAGYCRGASGNGIASIALKSGTHAAGTTDTYEITFTDGTTFDFFVYNGANGTGAGDMLAATYDPKGKAQDIFAYIDNAVSGVTVTTDATPTQGSTNPVQSGGVYSALNNKLDKTGDGSNITAAFTSASTRANVATGEKLSVLFGKIAKWFSDLGSLAFKSTVAKSDLASDVQTSLGKADSALQSYTETDPTVPAWAKAKTKPSYSKSEVGLGNVDNVKQYSASNPPPYPVTSVNGQTGAVTVQSGSEAAAYTATLTTSGWAQSGSRYAQTVNVTGVTASTPVVMVDVDLSGTDINADAASLEAWGIVSANNVAQGNGTLTFYALSVPSVNVPVNVGVC